MTQFKHKNIFYVFYCLGYLGCLGYLVSMTNLNETYLRVVLTVARIQQNMELT